MLPLAIGFYLWFITRRYERQEIKNKAKRWKRMRRLMREEYGGEESDDR